MEPSHAAGGGAFMLTDAGHKRRRKKDEDLRLEIEAFFVDQAPAAIQEVRHIVAPHALAMPRERMVVDWSSLREDVDAVKRLLELRRRLIEDDDEDTELLLLS